MSIYDGVDVFGRADGVAVMKGARATLEDSTDEIMVEGEPSVLLTPGASYRITNNDPAGLEVTARYIQRIGSHFEFVELA